MNRKFTHILIGLIIPTVIAVSICIMFGYINAKREMGELAKYLTTEDEMQDDAKIIRISKDNWDEYFTLDTKLVEFTDDEGKLIKVQYVNYFILKEEYHEKISMTQRESQVSITYKQPSDRIKYKITDAESGEWELTDALKGDWMSRDHDIKNFNWTRDYTKDSDFQAEYGFDTGEYQGQLFVQVPEKLKVEAVDGELCLKY